MATVVFPEIGNNGITTLATGISDSITTVVVTSAAALGFTDSTTDGYITIVDASNYRKNPLTSPETLEICQVTAVSTNTLTVTRGVDGTSGTVFAAGAVIEVRINAAMIQRVYDALTDGTDQTHIGTGLVGSNAQDAIDGGYTNSQSDDFVVSGSSHSGIGIVTPSTGTIGSIFFGEDPTSSSMARIQMYGSAHANANQLWINNLRSGSILLKTSNNTAIEIDPSQNTTFNGDLSIDAAAGGCNKTWEQWIPAQLFILDGATPPTAGADISHAANRRYYHHLSFDPDAYERAYCNFSLPVDYQGDSLVCDIYWTSAGNGSDDVYWAGGTHADTDGDDLSLGSTGGNWAILDSCTGDADDLVISTSSAFIPHDNAGANIGAGSSYLISMLVYRVALHASDDSVDASRLYGVRIRYA